MGASSGWNLVARRPPRPRAAPKSPARHLRLVPRVAGADPDRTRPDRTPPPEGDAEPTRNAG